MRHDLLDTFSGRFPHLASRIAAAAHDIADAEHLLDDATAAGLDYRHFAWIDLHEIQIHVNDPDAGAWLSHLGTIGYRNPLASYRSAGGHITAHLRHRNGKRISLVILNPEQAA